MWTGGLRRSRVVGRCGGARGRARRLRGLGRGVGGGLSRVSEVDNEMYCERLTLIVHFESRSNDIAYEFREWRRC